MGVNIIFSESSRGKDLYSYSLETKNIELLKIVNNVSDIRYLDFVSYSFDFKKVTFARDDKIYIRDLIEGTEIMIKDNHTNNLSTPSFSPDGTKIIYTNRYQSEIIEKFVQKNYENNHIFLREIDRENYYYNNPISSLVKYTMDGEYIVVLGSNHKTLSNTFYVIDLNSKKCHKKIEIYPKSLCVYSESEFLKLKATDSTNVSFYIKNFSISQSNSKIAFILQVEDSTHARVPEIIISEIYVINLEEESFAPKQIYQSKSYLTSLHWLPNNDTSIIFTECNYMKILSIDSIELSVLKDKEDNIIKGQVLGLIDNKN